MYSAPLLVSETDRDPDRRCVRGGSAPRGRLDGERRRAWTRTGYIRAEKGQVSNIWQEGGGGVCVRSSGEGLCTVAAWARVAGVGPQDRGEGTRRELRPAQPNRASCDVYLAPVGGSH